MKKRRIAICAKCDRERGIKARGLCASCYQVLLEWNPEGLADYPTRKRDPSMDVDEVAVDRAVEWGEDAEVVLYQMNNRYGANYGRLSDGYSVFDATDSYDGE